jgi:hypothetical protein
MFDVRYFGNPSAGRTGAGATRGRRRDSAKRNFFVDFK